MRISARKTGVSILNYTRVITMEEPPLGNEADGQKASEPDGGAMKVIDGCGCLLIAGVGLLVVVNIYLGGAFEAANANRPQPWWHGPAAILVFVVTVVLIRKWLRSGKGK